MFIAMENMENVIADRGSIISRRGTPSPINLRGSPATISLGVDMSRVRIAQRLSSRELLHFSSRSPQESLRALASKLSFSRADADRLMNAMAISVFCLGRVGRVAR